MSYPSNFQEHDKGFVTIHDERTSYIVPVSEHPDSGQGPTISTRNCDGFLTGSPLDNPSCSLNTHRVGHGFDNYTRYGDNVYMVDNSIANPDFGPSLSGPHTVPGLWGGRDPARAAETFHGRTLTGLSRLHIGDEDSSPLDGMAMPPQSAMGYVSSTPQLCDTGISPPIPVGPDTPVTGLPQDSHAFPLPPYTDIYGHEEFYDGRQPAPDQYPSLALSTDDSSHQSTPWTTASSQVSFSVEIDAANDGTGNIQNHSINGNEHMLSPSTHSLATMHVESSQAHTDSVAHAQILQRDIATKLVDEHARSLRREGSDSIGSFICSICKKDLTAAHNLKYHLWSHFDFRPFHCQESGCPYKATAPHTLTRHAKKHNKKVEQPRPDFSGLPDWVNYDVQTQNRMAEITWRQVSHPTTEPRRSN
ncbi:hypothetical protein K435DRAFT_794548 [Dendrothele bispora CBS 962.96]|uniref:C2H2-type domain-containing protein n=1 Tax=Dendrothele bispora (strain CBS 962.96) TaxID=1314807 RepID=A0A4S8MD70_DENBC|nr:hypothetical protein K435DRAFT_794548 [Dendrothele bispora CBS 962.96]